jgi:hypothetical protein
LIATAREQVAELLGAHSLDIIFTSCGTESNNTAIAAALRADPAKRHIVTSQVEHSSVLNYCMALERQNREQGIGDREQGKGNREEGTGHREEGTEKREQGRGNWEQGTGNRAQGRGNGEQGTGNGSPISLGVLRAL